MVSGQARQGLLDDPQDVQTVERADGTEQTYVMNDEPPAPDKWTPDAVFLASFLTVIVGTLLLAVGVGAAFGWPFSLIVVGAVLTVVGLLVGQGT